MGVEFYLFRPARPSLGIAELRSICGRAVEEWTADERSEVVDECVYCRRSEEDPLVDRPDEWEETTTFCRSGKHFRQSFVPGFAEFLTPHDLRDAGEEMLRDLFDIVLAEHVDDDFHDALDVEWSSTLLTGRSARRGPPGRGVRGRGRDLDEQTAGDGPGELGH